MASGPVSCRGKILCHDRHGQNGTILISSEAQEQITGGITRNYCHSGVGIIKLSAGRLGESNTIRVKWKLVGIKVTKEVRENGQPSVPRA